MCFYSIHNEGPPINCDPALAVTVTQGLVTGEAATSSMLRAMADCFQAMASMVDTGGATVAIWGEAVAASTIGDPSSFAAKAAGIGAKYAGIFRALDQTVERITFSIQKYRELQEYAHSALAAGRGEDFEKAFTQLGVGGFDGMVMRRIELLRKLKVRVQILTKLQTEGAKLLDSQNFPEFFMWFMQPMRDLSIALHDLHEEGLRGALASHRAMNQTCRMVGEELPGDILTNARMQTVRMEGGPARSEPVYHQAQR
jgi:hypothetical protein